MNFKYAVEYRYKKYFKILTLYGLLSLAAFIAMAITSLKQHDKSLADTSILFYISIGLSVIFGVISYDSEMKLFRQNGITRQQTHFSFLASLPVCLIAAIYERVYMTLLSLIINKGSKPCYSILSDIFGYKSSFVKNVLLEALIFITLMSIGYCLASILKSVKPIPLMIGIAALIIIIAIDISMVSLEKKLMPEIYYIPQLFLVGSAHGEILVKHFIAALTMLTASSLSISHIITLVLPVKNKGV